MNITEVNSRLHDLLHRAHIAMDDMCMCDESIRYYFAYKKGLDYRIIAEIHNARIMHDSELIMDCAQFILLLTLPGELESYDSSVTIEGKLDDLEFYVARIEKTRKDLEDGIFEYN